MHLTRIHPCIGRRPGQFYIGLCILLLTSCSAAVPATTTPTASPIPATSTATPTSIPTIAPTATAAYFTTQCLEVIPTLPADFELHKNLLLIKTSDERFISDVRGQHVIRKVSGNAFSVHSDTGGISPDGKWLAYYVHPNPNALSVSFLIVESVDGKRRIRIPWSWRWIVDRGPYWLDNEHVMLNALLDEPHQTGTPGLAYAEMASVVVINPFTDEKQYLHLSDYPDNAWIDQKPQKFVFRRGNVIYNPSLTRALYLAENTSAAFLVLWDRQASKPVTSLIGYSTDYSNPAFWLPAEKKFVLALSQRDKDNKHARNWFSLDQDGQLEQLTYFKYEDEWHEFYMPSFSPEGETIAFWYREQGQDRLQLFMLNIKTKVLTKYCLTGGAYDKSIWSLDGRFLMISNYTQKTSPTFLTYLIDIQRNWMVQIDKGDYYPLGFVTEP